MRILNIKWIEFTMKNLLEMMQKIKVKITKLYFGGLCRKERRME